MLRILSFSFSQRWFIISFGTNHSQHQRRHVTYASLPLFRVCNSQINAKATQNFPFKFRSNDNQLIWPFIYTSFWFNQYCSSSTTQPKNPVQRENDDLQEIEEWKLFESYQNHEILANYNSPWARLELCLRQGKYGMKCVLKNLFSLQKSQMK
jgi:hypothetical protein